MPSRSTLSAIPRSPWRIAPKEYGRWLHDRGDNYLDARRITLGIECKHWAQKVDGDVIDVAAAKKDDLGIDKFAVITVAGYEAGAELYARSKGIDLFVVRPSNDDDFGYSGKVVKFNLLFQGSRPVNVVANATLRAELGETEEAARQLKALLTDVTPATGSVIQRPNAIVWRYSSTPGPDGISIAMTLREPLGDLREIVEHAWAEHNQKFWQGNHVSRQYEIQFREPSALLLSPRTVVILNQVRFEIEYYLIEGLIEVDRGEKFPVVLENVIEGAITPLRVTTVGDKVDFSMAGISSRSEVDYSVAPPGVIGRGGATIVVTLQKPVDPAHQRDSIVHKLVLLDNDRFEWERLDLGGPSN